MSYCQKSTASSTNDDAFGATGKVRRIPSLPAVQRFEPSRLVRSLLRRVLEG